MSKKWQDALIIGIVAASITMILWLTLFSRLGSYSREFYMPFSSYKAVFNGSSRALLEILGNIVLFIPFGIAVALFFRFDIKHCLLFGFCLSLIIESCQWLLWLGSFEIDDLVHNTIGAGLGSFPVARMNLGESFKLKNRKKGAIALLGVVILITSLTITYQGLRWQEMKRLAALNDREDGKKNLLILSPEPAYIGNSDVRVKYNTDGSILIEGSSENRAWIQIGTMKLSVGEYILTGLSDTEEYTIALVLDAYDTEVRRNRRITQEVGAIAESQFVIEEEKAVRALISIYPGDSYSVIARPAVFQE